MTSNITTYSNQSSDKVLAILELISYSDEPLRLIDIANQLNFNTSTALRYLNTLEQNGYVYKDKETFKYRMTFKICDLASHVSKNNDLIVIVNVSVLQLNRITLLYTFMCRMAPDRFFELLNVSEKKLPCTAPELVK